jgi:hypothetical protein
VPDSATARRRQRTLLSWMRPALLAATLIAALSGCGDDPADGLPPANTGPPAGPPPTATIDPDHAPVLAALQGFVDAANAAATTPDPDHPALADYALPGAISLLATSIRNNQERGRKYAGAIEIVSAEVTYVDLAAPVPSPNAEIAACRDLINYTLVDLQTNEPIPAERRGLDQHMTTFQLAHMPDGSWKVSNVVPHWDEPC